MKQIIVIFGLTFFTLSSCNGQKSETEKAEIGIRDEPTLNTDYTEFNEPIITQGIDLYWLRDLEENENKKVGFVSLSDSYPLSEHLDSLAIPYFYDIEKENRGYFKLEQEYRKRFLSKTKIEITDSLFIYDYSTDVLFSFPVNKLNTVAYFNHYLNINNCVPCDQYDYMIGFEIDKSKLTGLSDYYQHTLVYVGKENPFTSGQMKSIIWKKIDSTEFPIVKSNVVPIKSIKNEMAYFLYDTDENQYFIQDYTEQIKGYNNKKRHLIIIDKESGSVVIERLFNNSEGTSLTPLNLGEPNEYYVNHPEQWTGKLFKNKPKVIFGFEWVSFGCPGINLIDPKMNAIYINCDNRH